MTLSTASYKGTRDFYPEDKQIQNYIFDTWKQVVEQFGYQEYATPLLEPIEIYAAKSGEELVNDQTYTFTDRGGRQVAIRPEMTPSICRLIAGRRQELAYPARLYSIANFMRYERPQKGREREFWQLNLDLFGDDSIYADLEIIQIADQIMRGFKAKPGMYQILLNDRRLVNFILQDFLGLDEEKSYRLTKLFDQKAKLAPDAYRQNLSKLVKDKAKVDQIINFETSLPAAITKSKPYQQVEELAKLARERGITNLVIDIFLMRGLDYYTGTVMEVFDTNPDNRRSLFGGGRYDGLVAAFGAEPISAVGIAPGASTIWEFLTGHGLLPKLQTSVDAEILVMDNQAELADEVARRLRVDGLKIAIDYSDRKLPKKLKSAAKKGIVHVIIIGQQEVDQSKLTLKNLQTGTSTQIDLPKISNLLNRPVN